MDFQMKANELYPIVKPARIVGIFGQTLSNEYNWNAISNWKFEAKLESQS